MEERIESTEHPQTTHVRMQVHDELVLNLYAIEFSNAIQIAVYNELPMMGSYTMSFPIQELTERVIIFAGKHEELSTAISQIVSRRTGKLVFASVFVKKDMIVTLDNVKDLLEKYFERNNTNSNFKSSLE